MARVTSAEVLEIIDTTLTLTPFITAANLMVTANLADKGLGNALLKEIERWLTAHLAATVDPRVASQSIKGTGVTFQTRVALRLDNTAYGQQVMILDWSGTMAALGTPLRSASLDVIGEVDADEYAED